MIYGECFFWNRTIQKQTDAAASLLDSKSNYFTAQIEVVLNERKRTAPFAMMKKDQAVYSLFQKSLLHLNTVLVFV